MFGFARQGASMSPCEHMGDRQLKGTFYNHKQEKKVPFNNAHYLHGEVTVLNLARRFDGLKFHIKYKEKHLNIESADNLVLW